MEKSYYYFLGNNFDALRTLNLLRDLKICTLQFENEFVIITAKEKDFSFIDDIIIMLA